MAAYFGCIVLAKVINTLSILFLSHPHPSFWSELILKLPFLTVLERKTGRLSGRNCSCFEQKTLVLVGFDQRTKYDFWKLRSFFVVGWLGPSDRTCQKLRQIAINFNLIGYHC